jgi:hypothetical protein
MVEEFDRRETAYEYHLKHGVGTKPRELSKSSLASRLLEQFEEAAKVGQEVASYLSRQKMRKCGIEHDK